ncbi:hypothetical protein SpCBS45565_g07902 [Spizellomyces sp. 'palustris']|nr:hypothetical protein SpCBS45565_g07902 [Spizellomyces sp. 'palustris']
MEQDLSTVLNDATDGDAAMADSHYDTREDRDSRDVRERDRDSRDVRERDSGAGSSRNGYLSPKKEGGSGPDAAPAPPAEHYGRSRSPGRERYGSSRRTPYDRPGGDSHGGSSSKYSAGRRDPNRPPSKKECRVYVGNLAYEVGWQDLKDFMRKAGEVVFADILTGPGGRSKGCGVVEYAAIEEAQKAIKELNDTPLMGRPVFIREDREQEAKFGSLGPTKKMDTAGRQIFVNNLPYIVAWQDLKDLFRQAGTVLRADVMEGPDRRSRGMGVVLFETAEEAHHAISDPRFSIVVVGLSLLLDGRGVVGLAKAGLMRRLEMLVFGGWFRV